MFDTDEAMAAAVDSRKFLQKRLLEDRKRFQNIGSKKLWKTFRPFVASRYRSLSFHMSDIFTEDTCNTFKHAELQT